MLCYAASCTLLLCLVFIVSPLSIRIESDEYEGDENGTGYHVGCMIVLRKRICNTIAVNCHSFSCVILSHPMVMITCSRHRPPYNFASLYTVDLAGLGCSATSSVCTIKVSPPAQCNPSESVAGFCSLS